MAIRVYPHLSPRVIEVLNVTEISIQDLTDQIKDWEDEPADLTYPILVKTFGKQPLGGGVFVGITAELQNAKVSFTARPPSEEIVCTISGGNLVAIDENGAPMNPIFPTAYVQVVLAQSSSATIATPPSDTNLLYLIESLRGPNKSLGNIYYWDPKNGADTNDGTTPSNAVKTFTAALTLVTDGNHDTIFCLASDTINKITTVTETINISVDTLKLRGPGYTFQFKPTSAGTAPVTISGDDVEFSGFYVEPKTGGSDNGISVSGNRAHIKDCWIKSATANGIDVTGSARTIIDTCAIENSGGQGINIGAGTALAKIKTSIVTGSTNTGVYLSGAGTTDNIIENNLIYQNSVYGVNVVSADVSRTIIRGGNTIQNNGSLPAHQVVDNGTDTIQEAPSGGESAATIAAAVWDEAIGLHTDAGSAGKTLKDAKTKATLASLK